MGGFEFISHTADVRMKISGDTLEDLFRFGISGIAEFLKPGFCGTIAGKEQRAINLSVSSIDKTALLVDFLSDILTFSHTEHSIFCSVKFRLLTETEAEADVFGASVEGFDKEIKAVTYHEAEIKRNLEGGKLETVIVFDI